MRMSLRIKLIVLGLESKVFLLIEPSMWAHKEGTFFMNFSIDKEKKYLKEPDNFATFTTGTFKFQPTIHFIPRNLFICLALGRGTPKESKSLPVIIVQI